ncbi:hypothetical protein [Limnochorda pilosa]|uniref:Uncharacterized protein n=1 Tax=Limnochorda pilosa TaxID=1555112 RepID=A0A0K2SQH0_LIMPI|nr:hypothetical protein [Limnochorda pilosa]BAS29378.1 hypothetical protein LIP_3567 [Limnochorda pilosa]
MTALLNVLRPVLELAALVLGVVNGTYILRHYRRDRPRIEVSFIHPDVYQWWFRLPPREDQGHPAWRFGFLLYIGISNNGLGADTPTSWHLHVPQRTRRRAELKPINVSMPTFQLPTGDGKVFPVLGQVDPIYRGDLCVEPGRSISGMAYYHLGVWGDAAWDPVIRDGRIHAELAVGTVLGQRVRAPVTLTEVPLAKVKEMIPEIEKLP